MRSEEEIKKVLDERINMWNDKDNSPATNDIIYGQITVLKWILGIEDKDI